MRMLKCCSYLLLFLLMFGCSLHGLSQNSLLWKVTSPKTHYDNYLYGTMHLQDYRVFQFGDSVLPAFKSCKVLATEILMDQAGIDLLKFMFVSDSTHAIKYHLQLHEYEFLKQYAQNHLGPVSAMIDQMHPFFIYSLIINQRTRHDKSKALDMILQELAVAEGLENMAIETIEEQMGAINKVSIEEQMDALKEIYGGLTEIDSLLELMLNQYAEQNLDGLMQTATQTGMSESVNKYLLTDRNMRMARRLDSMFLKKATFAAFGAAHLPGDSGVIELLKGRGYSIQQVSSTESVSWDIPIGFPAAWRALDHKSADFEIEFPATPDASTETLQTGDYEIDQQIYSCTFEAHQSTLGVVQMSLPKKALKDYEGNYLDDITSKFGEMGFEQISKTAHSCKGCEAVHLEIKMQDGFHTRYEYTLVDNTVFVVFYTGAPVNLFVSDVNYFFESFSF